jgi:hypothetical protein
MFPSRDITPIWRGWVAQVPKSLVVALVGVFDVPPTFVGLDLFGDVLGDV